MHGIQTAWVHFCMLPHAIHFSTQYAFPFDSKTIHNIPSAQNHLATDYMAHYCLNFVFEYVFISRLVVCRCSQKCVHSMVFRTVQRFLFRRLFYCVIPTDFREKNVSFTICRRAKVLECVSILVNRRDDTAAALEIHVSGEHQLSKWPHSHIAMEPHSYIAA